ncbi:hypothetical protein PPYR_12388 [Photinus pyralis]|uniref:Cystinosin n=1 Tax=Photinus pyralis TaxID=7054 RepID=A0A1Y1LJQ7_PHOPY|nr:cystinosin homolog [Photinus pyralis]KAB0795549.1 hypothetical protein PPYR_12388 [Photinus pyralis]
MLCYQNAGVVLFFIAGIGVVIGEISISTKEVLVQTNDVTKISVTVRNASTLGVQISLNAQHEDIVSVLPTTLFLQPFNETYELVVRGRTAGHSEVSAISNDTSIVLSDIYLITNVCNSYVVDILSKIAGWIYIISWGSSFYPQIYSNYKRKSVVGLNFDYVGFNLIGYVSFGIFISGLYFVPYLQQEYFALYPRGLIPVKTNDVVYNFHGTFAVLLTIFQCCIYERARQTVSNIAKVLMGILALFYIVCGILIATGALKWLSFLYYCSYLKLIITLLKYIPQAYMNYKRKSTSGWSIGLVLLDLTGGLLSVVQMILDAYNYNDWLSIFGNPTKFGLGLFNIFIHSFFITQHYVLYRERPLEPAPKTWV